MSQGGSRLPLSGHQLRVILVVTIGIWFGLRYAQGIMAETQVQHELATAQQSVSDAQARRDGLQKRLEYVKTDNYVEAVARQALQLVKPGDVAIKVVPTHPAPGPQAQSASVAAPSSQRPIDQWRELFFGSVR